MNPEKCMPFICFCLTFGLVGLNAQQAILTSGGDANGSGGSVAFSVGQAAYTHYGGETGSISLGVQQPYLMIIIGTTQTESNLIASAYPNPTDNVINLQVELQDPQAVFSQLFYTMFDVEGKMLQHQEITDSKTIVSMDHLADGLYIIKITRKEEEIKSFKIIKTK